MKKSKIFLAIGCIMLLIAVVFIIFAMTHPEMSFTYPLPIVYLFYILYLVLTATMFIIAKKIS